MIGPTNFFLSFLNSVSKGIVLKLKVLTATPNFQRSLAIDNSSRLFSVIFFAQTGQTQTEPQRITLPK